MNASVTRIPVAMKRGRKVTKGPMASIVQLRATKAPSLRQRSNHAQISLAGAVAALRILKDHDDRTEWINAIERMILDASHVLAELVHPMIEAEKEG